VDIGTGVESHQSALPQERIRTSGRAVPDSSGLAETFSELGAAAPHETGQFTALLSARPQIVAFHPDETSDLNFNSRILRTNTSPKSIKKRP
jgi:hypothetical protein